MSENPPKNPPAFPEKIKVGHSGGEILLPGMTLLDYFAAKAMLGEIISALAGGGHYKKEKLAQRSYEIAQAMLKEREKHDHPGNN